MNRGMFFLDRVLIGELVDIEHIIYIIGLEDMVENQTLSRTDKQIWVAVRNPV